MARTYLFWDPLSDNILQERDETGAVTAEYTTEPGLYGNLAGKRGHSIFCLASIAQPVYFERLCPAPLAPRLAIGVITFSTAAGGAVVGKSGARPAADRGKRIHAHHLPRALPGSVATGSQAPPGNKGTSPGSQRCW